MGEVENDNPASAGALRKCQGSIKQKFYSRDVVTAQVYVKYADFNSDEVNIMPLVNYVASSFVMPAGIDGGITPDFNFMNGSWYSGFLGNNTTTSEPRAFLNSILLDNNLQVQRDEEGNPLIDIVQVSEAAKIPEDGSGSDHELLKLTVTVKKEGYIYIYLSNDDQQDMDVYFDDFKVTHKLNDIVAGGDYYPFGSVMTGREITRDDYRFGYQGQFSEYDEETGWNSFELRMYDPTIARWSSPDPYKEFASPYVAMGNNPVNAVDPTGGFTGGGDPNGPGIKVGIGPGSDSWAYATGQDPYPIQYSTMDHVGAYFSGIGDAFNNRIDQLSNLTWSSFAEGVADTYDHIVQSNLNPLYQEQQLENWGATLSYIMALSPIEKSNFAGQATYYIAEGALLTRGAGITFRGLGLGMNYLRNSFAFSSRFSSNPVKFHVGIRHTPSNFMLRLERAYRSPVNKGTASGPQLGTHINISKQGSFNYHIYLNPFKWKYYY